MIKSVIPKNLKRNWIKNRPRFTKESLLIKGYQVMQKWEKEYMKELADVVTSRRGNILEIGFGLGISAGYIQKNRKVKKHLIVEAHPEIIKYAIKLFSKNIQKGKVNLLQGFWEDILPYLKDNQFDGILFDTNPISREKLFFHFLPFFKEAHRLLKRGGVFTYFSDEQKEISKRHLNLLRKAGFRKVNYKTIKVKPPRYCRYWHYNMIVIPIVHK